MSASDDGHTGKDEQAKRFAQAARELECDEDESRWDERLKKVAKRKNTDAESAK